MSAPGSSLPPRPAHLPAPPAFPPPPAPPPSSLARPAGHFPPDYHGEPSRRERDDRYDDRRDYDDRKRRRSDASEERRDLRPRIDDRVDRTRLSTVPAIRDPEELETLVNKPDWISWFRSRNPAVVADDEALEKQGSLDGTPTASREQRMQERYDAYRKRFVSRQLYALFLIHNPSAWFRERYSMAPESVALRERVQKQARDGLAEQFIAEVNGGQWDAVSYDLVADGEDRTQPLAGDDASRPKPALEDGQVAAYPSPDQLIISSLPVDASRVKLEEACSKLSGFKRLALGPALEENRFVRTAWVDLEPGTDLAAAAAELNGQKLEDSNITLQVAVNDAPVVSKPKLAPEGSNTLERLEKDFDQARRLIVLLQAETDGTTRTAAEHDGLKAIDTRLAALAPAPAPDAPAEAAEAKLRRTKLHLDLYLAYLRRVFHTCYYSGSINDSREELESRSLRYLRKVPAVQPPAPVVAAAEEAPVDATAAAPPAQDEAAKEPSPAPADAPMDDEDPDAPRREDNDEPTAAAAAAAAPAKTAEQLKADTVVAVKLSDLNSLIWSQGVDSRIERLLNRATTDPVTVGGKDFQLEHDKLVLGYVKHEDEGKFRCKECLKLFKAAEFVKKHVPNKHPDLLNALDTVRAFNNFVLDPLHVVPPPGAPASVNDQPPTIRVPTQAPAPLAGFPPGTQFPPGFIAPWMNPMLPPAPGQGMLSSTYTPGFVGFGPLNPYMQYAPMAGMVGLGAGGGRGRAPGGGGPGRYQQPRRSDQPEQRPPVVDTTVGRPAGVRDDPRASRGRVSYNDLDANVPDGGEVKLDY